MSEFKIVGATGCPTGIAHTYMAQEALEQAAENAGVTIKVETHGQIGIENQLTPEEIENADCVIIASDKDVHPERFKGKRVIDVSVGKGIRDADKLIEQALQGGGRIFSSSNGDQNSEDLNYYEDESSSNIGRTIYKHLMNGVSHMLPFVVGGGVLIALSFLWGIHSADPTSSDYNQIAELLNTVGGVSMGLMVPVFAGFIGDSISRRPGLVAGFVGGTIANTTGAGFLGGILAGFLGGYFVLLLQKALKGMPKTLDGLKAIFILPVLGVTVTGVVMALLAGPVESINLMMMDFLAGFQGSSPIILGVIVGIMCAADMGGPINKAAYVTGTVLLGQGNYYFMAGVSAACIAPPLITTFATQFYKKYYSKEDINSGLVNIILGSTHITEGAIPFAAKDPLRVLPSVMLGSSIAASLTYMFKVQVPAPHGGFLVLPVVTGAIQWVFAILVGSMVGGLVMGYLQKRAVEAGKKNTDIN